MICLKCNSHSFRHKKLNNIFRDTCTNTQRSRIRGLSLLQCHWTAPDNHNSCLNRPPVWWVIVFGWLIKIIETCWDTGKPVVKNLRQTKSWKFWYSRKIKKEAENFWKHLDENLMFFFFRRLNMIFVRTCQTKFAFRKSPYVLTKKF